MHRIYIFMALLFMGVYPCHGQQVPKLVKSFELLPGTFAGTLGADLNGKYVSDSLGTLLISDGTDTGTHSVYSFYRISAMLPMGGMLYLMAADSAGHYNELWITDGSSLGTHRVKVINPDPDSLGILHFGFNDYSFIGYRGIVYFYANDGVHGIELWRTDGTDTGTFMLKDINLLPGGSINNIHSFPFGEFAVANDRLYFSANDGIHGPELWTTDGTPTGTRLVYDLCPGAIGANPQYLTPYNGRLCFWAANNADTGLFITDGTDTGTHLLVSHIFTPNSEQAVMDGKLYFFADTPGVAGSEGLWVTDGSATGTHWVAHAFYGRTQYSYTSYLSAFLTAFQHKLYFAAADNLWESDGTAAGTKLFIRLSDRPELCCTPTQLTEYQHRLYFKALNFNGRVDVLSTDGTDTGTHVCSYPGADYSTTSTFVYNNYLTFPLTPVLDKLFYWNTYHTAVGHSLFVFGQHSLSVPFFEASRLGLTIYPNPANDIVQIAVAEGSLIKELSLFTLCGQQIPCTMQISADGATLLCKGIPPQTLILRITTDTNEATSLLLVIID